jgi:serine/threonine protein kinase/Tfp pilus assembly protein PilF
MTPERWQKLKGLCDLALQREPGQRASFLAEACAEDDELRREAESMIARATSGGGILDGPIWKDFGLEADPGDVVVEAVQPIPETIGRYRILRVIGEGGMGVVYEAEQDQPRRRVALKVIRPGLASVQMLRRFDRESQALARLHHVGIAQIYEAGSTQTNHGPQPYFAMEFIHGTPLRHYADSHHLGAKERLEIMAKVCEAVEHAHQNGIIHRDLKPGNILVDETGQPKILDFGVARLTDSDAQVTKQTDLGQLIGTLAYMSPEQVLGDPGQLDSRSDVYALGVILYELLAQRRPYEISDQLLDAVRTIREEDPKRLSSISRAFRGDVETIVAKALEKDKARRYVSAAAMQADIRRYLADEPITARPASTIYQLQKFAQRHKALVSATAIVFLVLVAGIVVSTREAVKARRAEQISEAVNDFLQNDLLAQASASTQASPSTKPDPHLEVRTVLDRAAAKIGGKFDKEPQVEAAIRSTIGQTYGDLGLFNEAQTQLEGAVDLYRTSLGPKNAKTLKTMSELGRTAFDQGKYAEAEALLTQALDIQRSVVGSESPDTLYSMNNLAEVYRVERKYGPAETLHSQTLEIRRRVLGPEHLSTLGSMGNLAIVYYLEGKVPQAEALQSQTLETERRVLGAEHPRTLISMNNLANMYDEHGKRAQAEALYREALEIQRRVLGPEHGATLMSMDNLASLLIEQGKYMEAEALESQAVEIRRRVAGPGEVHSLVGMENLAEAYTLRAKYPQAEALYGHIEENARRTLGQDHPFTLGQPANLASMYQRQGKYELAGTYAAQALAGRRRALGADDPSTMASQADLALAYVSQGKFAVAEPLSREALETEKKIQPDDWQRYRAESLLGASLAGQSKYAEAEPLLLEGYQGMLARKDRIDVPDWYHLDQAHKWLIHLYRAWGKPEKAAEWSRK